MRHFVSILNPDILAFESYQSKTKQLLADSGKAITKNSLSTMVADLIEPDFNDLWFSSPQYSENRKATIEHVKKGASPFKIEIANLFAQIKLEDILEKWSEEIAFLKKIGNKSIAGVINTNYDPFSNLIYPDFNTYIGQEELIFSHSASARFIRSTDVRLIRVQ